MRNLPRLTLIALGIITLGSSLMAHSGHRHDAPWEACSDLKKEDNCSYHDANKDLFKGSCQLFNTHLMCVRNQPIIRANTNPINTENNTTK